MLKGLSRLAHERGFEVGSTNLEYMSNFVIWPFEISDGGISAAIQNYELHFETWNLWGLFCLFLSLLISLGVFWETEFFGPKVR